MAISVVAILTLYCFERDMTVLLFAALPDNMKTTPWFVLLLLLEANMWLYSGFICNFIFQLHILFPEALNRLLKRLASYKGHDCGRPAEVSRVVGQIRCIQLLINMFNTGHRHVIYNVKLFCITAVTLNGYAAIAHIGNHPVFGLISFCVAFDLLCLYAFVYAKAFAIPDGLESLKRELRMRTGLADGRSRRARRALDMQIKSIPQFGLKVGDFHMLERVSTPVFIDYVVKNIVNLLVTM